VWVLTVNLIPFIISRFSTPIYIDKYTIAASVAFYALVAKGICNINYRYAQIAVIGIIVVLSVANLQVSALINGPFNCARFAFFTQYC
jgi:hypothetical protein